MKRDMDLIRDLLIEIEKEPLCDGHHLGRSIDIPGRSVDEVNYHLNLLTQARYVKGHQAMLRFNVTALTWEGHEFLENIRDPKIWHETKERAKGLTGVGLSVLESIATSIIKAHLHLP